jgi:HK97 family phage major capsid protein/HK97 family phage prohead protease
MTEILTREQIISKATNETHKRSFVVDRAKAVEGAERTLELSFASDTPCPHFSYRLFDYIDVKLAIDKRAVRTERLRNGMAVLMGHDYGDWRAHVGVVRAFTIDETNGKVRAVCEFSDSADGDQIYREMKSGIRQNISVGFNIHKLVLEEENEEGNDLYRADDWEPFELSIVSIPADISVGVGRSAEFLQKNNSTTETKMSDKNDNQPAAPAVDDQPQVSARTAQEARTVEDLNNQIKFGETFGFAKEVREAALANPEFTMADARMLVQQLKGKADDVAKRVKQVITADKDSGTMGSAFTSSDEYRSLVPKSGQKKNFIIQTRVLPTDLFKRAAYTGSGDGLTSYDVQPGIVELGQQQPTVADLFMQAQTDAPTIRYMRETSFTNGADMVLEGDDKPEGTFVLEEVDAAVRKAAVWSKVTDETLEDYSQIRPYIDQRLAFMVRNKIDNQLLNGTGTAPEIAGLLGTSGVQTQEMTGTSAEDLAEAIMKAITKVRNVGFFEPDAIVMNPNDYEKLRLAKDGNDQYYGGGFFLGQYGNSYSDPGRIWGLRVVQTTAISEIDLATPGASNKGPVVGAFKLGGAVHYRNGLSIEATNHDQDDFIMNLTTIRVEQRLALAIYRPLAFCRVINAA